MSSNLISTSIQLGSERKNYLPVVAKLIHDKAGNPARCVCFPGSQKERSKTAAEAETRLYAMWTGMGFCRVCVCMCVYTGVCVCAEAGGRRQASSSTVVQLLF